MEGIGRVHRAVGVAVGLEDRAHEDHRAAAPHAGLDQIAGNVVFEHLRDALLDVVEALETDHRLRETGPVAPVGAHVGPVEVLLRELLLDRLPHLLADDVAGVLEADIHRPVERVGERALHEVEIATAQTRNLRVVVRRIGGWPARAAEPHGVSVSAVTRAHSARVGSARWPRTRRRVSSSCT